MGKNTIPDRWLPYTPMGTVIQGTRFIACKVPLKESLLKKLPENERFGTEDLVKAFPNLGLLIDLTNTTRYYFKQDFTDKDIQYEKIFCPGHVVPPNSIVTKFFNVVDDFLASNKDSDSLIAVHCTHGVNRTGYFICRYMIQKMNMTPEEAVKRFQEARGHNIERKNYVDDLKDGCKGGSEANVAMVAKEQSKFSKMETGKVRDITTRRNQPYKREKNKYEDYKGYNKDRSTNSISTGPRNYERRSPDLRNWRKESVEYNSPLGESYGGEWDTYNYQGYSRRNIPNRPVPQGFEVNLPPTNKIDGACSSSRAPVGRSHSSWRPPPPGYPASRSNHSCSPGDFKTVQPYPHSTARNEAYGVSGRTRNPAGRSEDEQLNGSHANRSWRRNGPERNTERARDKGKRLVR